MKIIFALVGLCVAVVCFADDASNIHTKTFEKKDKDGNVVFRMETTYRGKTKVMVTTSRPKKEGKMVVSSRSYLAGGDLIMTEADEKHDGTLQTIAIYHHGSDDMEVFIRQPDGSAQPVSAKTLEAYKEQISVENEFIKTMTETNLSDEKFNELFHETQKKIQDAQQEKTNN